MDYKNSRLNHDELMKRQEQQMLDKIKLKNKLKQQQQSHGKMLQRALDELDSLPTDSFGASGGTPHFNARERKILSAQEYLKMCKEIKKERSRLNYVMTFTLGVLSCLLTQLFLSL